MEDQLDIKFNIIRTDENLPVEVPPVEKNVLISEEDHVINDFDETRANLISVLQVGTTAVRNLGDIATQSQDPDAYIALAKLIAAMTDGSTKLLQIHEQKEKLKIKNTTPSDQPGELHQNNLIMVGSTQDLAQALKSISRSE